MLSDNMMLGGSGRKAAYSMENSLLFRGGQSLYRPFTTSATIGLSMWVRRAKLGVISPLLGTLLKFNANDTLTAWNLTTTAAYRDPTAWMHIAIAAEHLYVNGEDKGAVMTSAFTCSATNCLGYDGTNYFHGEFAEFVLADGGQPAIGHYGEFDPVTLNWRPKLVSLPVSIPSYQPINMVPQMTGYTAPSGTVTASSSISTTPAWCAFDRVANSPWQSADSTGWVSYEHDTPFAAGGYGIQAHSTDPANRHPKDWTFEGWNGSSWVVLDTQTNQIGWAGNEWRYYAFANSTTYSSYRLNITALNGAATIISVNEIEIFATAGLTAYGTNGCYLGKSYAAGAALGFDHGGTAPATSYSNFGGSGNRSGFMSVSSTGTWGVAPTTGCVDGSTSGTLLRANGSPWNTYSIAFDFGLPVCFDAFRTYADSVVNYGSTKWQASSDGVTYADVGSSYTFASASGVMTEMVLTGTTGAFYRHWRLVGNSTTATISLSWLYEIEFKTTAEGRHWTPVGFVSTDVVTDTPTNVFATLSPLDYGAVASQAPRDGNLVYQNTTPYSRGIRGTMAIPRTGVWMWEYSVTTGAPGAAYYGLGKGSIRLDDDGLTPIASAIMYHGINGSKYVLSTSGSAYGDTFATGDYIGIVANAGANTLTFYKNGVSQGVIAVDLTTETWFPFIDHLGDYCTTEANFGQRTFAFPNAYGTAKPLCTANMPATTGQTSGSFTGNANADGPCIYTGAVPETLTINGNAVTWGTHADKLATGFKVRSASASYNASSSNSWTATYNKKPTVGRNHVPANAQATP